MRVLSTKKLKPNQRDLLLGAGCSVVDYDAISIEFLDFEMPETIENAIFTSQNGVKSFLEKYKSSPFSLEGEGLRMKVFCVGQKTKALLEQNGLEVTKMVQNSTELGRFIVKNHQKEQFYYFCGSKRRDELPNILNGAKIEYFEVKTYKTELKPRKFDQKWDGILFFSPSGVESFATGLDPKGFLARPTGFSKPCGSKQREIPAMICIGPTTAEAAKKYFKNVIIANSTSIESVIAKSVKVLKK